MVPAVYVVIHAAVEAPELDSFQAPSFRGIDKEWFMVEAEVEDTVAQDELVDDSS